MNIKSEKKKKNDSEYGLDKFRDIYFNEWDDGGLCIIKRNFIP
jgi:hypothetical protein